MAALVEVEILVTDADEGLVLIRIRPDAQGRFGFNVKGGCDQNYPIIVSRVAPGSPADVCYPRLNEGDQVREEVGAGRKRCDLRSW